MNKRHSSILFLATMIVVVGLMMVNMTAIVNAQTPRGYSDPLICDQFEGSSNAIRTGYYMGEGTAFYRSGQLQRATDSFSCIITQIDTNYLDAYTARAVVFTDRRDYTLALEDYATAIGLDSSLIGAYNNRAIVYAAQGDYDAALADFDRALDIDSNYRFALSNRGVLYALRGDYAAAIADLENVITLSGVDDALAELRRPNRLGTDPLPVYSFEDARAYSLLGIIYSRFALTNYQDYLYLLGGNADLRIQSASGALESRFNFDLRLDDGTWYLATDFIPGG